MILSLQIRNYKKYNKNTFVRFGGDETAFSAIIGKNGVGKSTLLEALDTLLNNKEWVLNSSSRSKKEGSYIAIIFRMSHHILSKVDSSTAIAVSNVLKKIPSEFSAQKTATNEAVVKLKSFLEVNEVPETIGIIGKAYEAKSGKKFYAGDTVHDFLIDGLKKELSIEKQEAEERFSSYCKSCLEGFSYTYISVEEGIPELLKVEAQLMEKILPQDVLSGITSILDSKRITIRNNNRGKNPKKSPVGLINDDLNEIAKKISTTVKEVDDSYSYKSISSNKNLTSKDLADAIVKSFFSSKSFVKNGLPVERLSSGEKRMALLDIVFSFLRELEKDKFNILAVDEPEASLHISSSFDQFRKLIRIAEDTNCQVFCTSHWYGFIPIVKNGGVLYLDGNSGSYFVTEDFVPGNHKIPTDVLLKSGFELAGSIINSIRDEPITWVICEGGTDKKYLESFLEKKEDVRVVAASNDITVINLFKQLSMSLKGVNKRLFPGKVICLIDTDPDTADKIKSLEGFSNIDDVLDFRRLNMINNVIRFSPLSEKKIGTCRIEDLLCASTVARLASRDCGVEFNSGDTQLLQINSDYPGVTVAGNTIGELEGVRLLKRYIFSASSDNREISNAKNHFCMLYIKEISDEEKRCMLDYWESQFD
ncbi:MAG: AAA family ATPase [Gammaproteobacteria bacterium]|nr:AAA family ATPase [Gammaproteobacteria bacterium]